MTKKTIWIIVLIICLSAFVASAVYFLNLYFERRKIENLRDDVAVSSTEQPTEEKEDKTVEVPVDFDKLKKANPDIYAWISIPEVKVDYPILQSESDNGYYLNHTVNGQKSAYGSIYTEDYNNKDFSDFNTLVYGHNMKNGTMFGSLKKFRDAEFFKKNRFITVYTPGRILKYEIFAAYTWDNKHILLTRNFETGYNRKSYIEEIFAVRDMKSQINKEITVTEDDRIITLSTCMGDKSKRFLVSGVLVYDSAED
jgi:sortase B